MSTEIIERFQLLYEHAKVVNRSTAVERIAKLKRLASAITNRQADIEKALFDDFGKPAVEARLNEIFVVQHDIKYAIKHLRKWMKPKSVKRSIILPTASAEIKVRPKGTVLIISPWNFPFNLAIGPLVSAVAAGNTIALKPSEVSPNTSAIIESLISDLFPENEVAVFQGDKEVAEQLLSLPFNHIFFTGSPQIGKVVMEAAAQNLTSVTLELGGKSPVIVDETADIDKAVERIIWGKFINGGQTCIAPDYLILDQKIEKQFLQKAKEQIETYYGQNPKSNPDYCKIVNQRHTERIKTWFDESISMGANVVTGGFIDVDHCHIDPTIVSGLSDDSPLMQYEIFGPILPVISASGLDEAISIVDSKDRPLALYMFSDRKSNVEYVMNRTISGGVTVNDVVIHFIHPELPFGGINFSGIGNAHGEFGFKAFSHEQSVLHHNSFFSPLSFFYPPYSKKTGKLASLFIKYLGR